jgi:hypothetical protein
MALSTIACIILHAVLTLAGEPVIENAEPSFVSPVDISSVTTFIIVLVLSLIILIFHPFAPITHPTLSLGTSMVFVVVDLNSHDLLTVILDAEV